MQLVSTEGGLVENDENETTNKSQESNESEKTENTNATVQDEQSETDSKQADNSSQVATETSSSSTASYFTELKLKRDNIYSQKLEVYGQMVNSTTISSEQKAIAIQEVAKLTETQNAILVAEELIKLKGFEDGVIYVNGDSISVVVRSAALSQEQVAQVQNIVSRELNVDVKNISISNK